MRSLLLFCLCFSLRWHCVNDSCRTFLWHRVAWRPYQREPHTRAIVFYSSCSTYTLLCSANPTLMMCCQRASARHFCRFFKPAEFEEELALYCDPVLSKALPTVRFSSDNRDCAARSRSGFVFPPFIVLERGVTLSNWARKQQRSSFSVALMVEELGKLLAGLHDAGLVHRDIKPDNALYLLNSTTWRLLDVGIVAKAGALRNMLVVPRPLISSL